MIEIVKEMWDDGWLGRMLLVFIVALVAMIPLMIYASIQEQKDWETFAETHECKVVGRMKGDVGVGVGTGIMSNGKFGTGTVVTSTPDKTGYLCNDGVTYWR